MKALALFFMVRFLHARYSLYPLYGRDDRDGAVRARRAEEQHVEEAREEA